MYFIDTTLLQHLKNNTKNKINPVVTKLLKSIYIQQSSKTDVQNSQSVQRQTDKQGFLNHECIVCH